MPDTAPAPVLATLTADDAAALRDAHRRYADALRRAELAAARAKVDIGEAHEAVLTVARALGAAHGYDPDQPCRLVGLQLLPMEPQP